MYQHQCVKFLNNISLIADSSIFFFMRFSSRVLRLNMCSTGLCDSAHVPVYLANLYMCLFLRVCSNMFMYSDSLSTLYMLSFIQKRVLIIFT